MSELRNVFERCIENNYSNDNHLEYILRYIREDFTKKDLDVLRELFRKYKKRISSIIQLEIIKKINLDNEFLEEFKEVLFWELIFEYQDFDFNLFRRNREFFKKYDIEKMIKKDKIKMTKKNRDKFIDYFNMK
jgi:hypothetical protein